MTGGPNISHSAHKSLVPVQLPGQHMAFAPAQSSPTALQHTLASPQPSYSSVHAGGLSHVGKAPDCTTVLCPYNWIWQHIRQTLPSPAAPKQLNTMALSSPYLPQSSLWHQPRCLFLVFNEGGNGKLKMLILVINPVLKLNTIQTNILILIVPKNGKT